MKKTGQRPFHIVDPSVAPAEELRLTLARVADRLGAQRSELFEFEADAATLRGRWTAHGMPIALDEAQRVPLNWFPWSLGSIRPQEYLFVRNASVLPMTTSGSLTGADLSIAAALMVPIVNPPWTLGALCVYWNEERQDWESSDRELVVSWVFDHFDTNR